MGGGVNCDAIGSFFHLNLDASFNLNIVVSGHGEAVQDLKSKRLFSVHSRDKVLRHLFFILEDGDDVGHSFAEAVKAVFRLCPGLSILEALPNRHCHISSIFLSLVAEFKVIAGTPRRHGGEELVCIHFGHGSLREAHHRFNVRRLDVNVHLSVDVADEQGK